jgi:hypothetical protein
MRNRGKLSVVCKKKFGSLGPQIWVKEKNQLIAEYCLQGYTQPMGISEWQKNINKGLPPELKSSLPSTEELESELNIDQA